jgi:hypothetical protein
MATQAITRPECGTALCPVRARWSSLLVLAASEAF